MTFVDTNIVIDLLELDPIWSEWSARQIAVAVAGSDVRASAIVAAECASRFDSLRTLSAAFGALRVELEDLPTEAAFAAGRLFRHHRRSGDDRSRILPDFMIGAHAQHRRAPLITRDPPLYRRYFADVQLITPETHP